MKKIEFGRSMVEMLGVLALIGVLSVTGIYGYTIAMRKYRSNEVVQTASVLAIMAHSMDQGRGGCLELASSDLPKKPGGVDVEIVADATRGDPVTVYIHTDDDLCNFIEDSSSASDSSGYVIECNTDVTTCPE